MNAILDTPSAIEARLSAREQALALIEQRRDSPEWQTINRWEQLCAEMPQVRCILDHVFTPGLALRSLFMPAGTEISSKIHLFEHPYIVAVGICDVWEFETGWHRIVAPFVGITKPATRRLLKIIEPTIWITCHATSATNADALVAEAFYDHMKLGHMDKLSPEKLEALRVNHRGELP